MAIERTYLFASIEVPETLGEIESWPLHTTIVPWFEADSVQLGLFDKTVHEILGQYQPFTILGEEEDYFGPKNEDRVRKISSPVLRTIRHDLVAAVEGFGWSIDKTYGYNPHISYRESRGMDAGQTYMIRAFQRGAKAGGKKSIAAVYKLGQR